MKGTEAVVKARKTDGEDERCVAISIRCPEESVRAQIWSEVLVFAVAAEAPPVARSLSPLDSVHAAVQA